MLNDSYWGVRTIKLKTPLDAFQEFRLRVGIAVGPVIAGVVGKY